MRHLRLPLSLLLPATLAMFVACGGSEDSSDQAAPAAGGASGAGGAKAGAGGQPAGGSAGKSGGAAGGAAGSGDKGMCGNSKVEKENNEDCDDGNKTAGDGCEADCTYTCNPETTGNAKCDDKNPCNGAETCAGVKGSAVCKAGAPLADGAACDTGKVCIKGVCAAPSCGDGKPQTGEECDDGNAKAGDGCEPGCLFTCKTGDPKRGCASTNPCVLDGQCQDATTHTCKPGATRPDGAPCGAGKACVAGVCKASACGDGALDAAAGEACDDGNTTDGDGCEKDCTFTCKTPAASCPAAPACRLAACVDVLAAGVKVGQKCATQPDPAADGQSPAGCDAPSTCTAGACNAPGATCGNGVVEAGETCDFGAQNGAGTGCESNCTPSCTKSPDSCLDQNPCNGAESCADVSVGPSTGQACAPGAAAPDGTGCGGANICLGGACALSSCGDGYVDAGAGEQCEPPGSAGCDAGCKAVQAAACGDGKVDAGEECDDGGTANLDGCDAGCKYEMAVRLTSAVITNAVAPSGCVPTTNAFGRNVLAGAGRSTVNDSLKTAIEDGSTNVVVPMLGLDDLTGVADADLKLGLVAASPDPAKGAWPGAAPLDWWFLASSSNVDASGLPTSFIQPASVSGRTLTAGPSDTTITLLIAGTPAPLAMRDANIFATLDGTPAPSKPGAPPANLAAGLVTFQTVTANASGTQGLCGNITVESLAQIPVPEALTTGTTACNSGCSGSSGYTYCGKGMPVGAGCNSLLDAVVGGCKATFLCVGAINASQPDVAGAGFSGKLGIVSAGSGQPKKVPEAQWKGNTRAYSSYITFTANRTHLTGKN